MSPTRENAPAWGTAAAATLLPRAISPPPAVTAAGMRHMHLLPGHTPPTLGNLGRGGMMVGAAPEPERDELFSPTDAEFPSLPGTGEPSAFAAGFEATSVSIYHVDAMQVEHNEVVGLSQGDDQVSTQEHCDTLLALVQGITMVDAGFPDVTTRPFVDSPAANSDNNDNYFDTRDALTNRPEMSRSQSEPLLKDSPPRAQQAETSPTNELPIPTDPRLRGKRKSGEGVDQNDGSNDRQPVTAKRPKSSSDLGEREEDKDKKGCNKKNNDRSSPPRNNDRDYRSAVPSFQTVPRSSRGGRGQWYPRPVDFNRGPPPPPPFLFDKEWRSRDPQGRRDSRDYREDRSRDGRSRDRDYSRDRDQRYRRQDSTDSRSRDVVPRGGNTPRDESPSAYRGQSSARPPREDGEHSATIPSVQPGTSRYADWTFGQLTSRVIALETTNAELESKVAKVEDEKKELKSENTQLNTLNNDLQADLGKKAEEFKTHLAKQTQVDVLRRQQQTALEDENKKLKEELAAIKAQLEAAAASSSEVDSLKSELAQAKAQIAQTKEVHANEINRLTTKLQTADNDATKARNEMKDAEAKARELSESLRNADASRVAADKKANSLAAADEKCKKAEEQLAKVKKDQVSAAAAQRYLENERDAGKKKVAELEATVKSLGTEVETLKKSKEELDKVKAVEVSTATALKATEKERDEGKKTISELETTAKRLEGEVSELKKSTEELDKIKAEQSSISKERDAANKQVQQLRAKVKMLEAEVGTSTKRVEELQKAKSELDRQEHEVLQLSTHLTHLLGKLEAVLTAHDLQARGTDAPALSDTDLSWTVSWADGNLAQIPSSTDETNEKVTLNNRVRRRLASAVREARVLRNGLREAIKTCKTAGVAEGNQQKENEKEKDDDDEEAGKKKDKKGKKRDPQH